MNRAVGYGLLIAVPPAFAVGSGLILMTRQPILGGILGVALGVVLFAIVFLGSEYGSRDDGSVGEL